MDENEEALEQRVEELEFKVMSMQWFLGVMLAGVCQNVSKDDFLMLLQRIKSDTSLLANEVGSTHYPWLDWSLWYEAVDEILEISKTYLPDAAAGPEKVIDRLKDFLSSQIGEPNASDDDEE